MSEDNKTADSKSNNGVPLSEINITDQNVALNVMIALLNQAQRRGAFTMEEASKAWESIKMFKPPQLEASVSDPTDPASDPTDPASDPTNSKVSE
jgi:hypothetical protein